MDSGGMQVETPTRGPTARARAVAEGVTRSPSQRLKDLFFSTYTGGSSPSERTERGPPLTSAALLPPPQARGEGKDQSEDDDRMDVDVEEPMPEAEPGPAPVPLAISTGGRFYSEHLRRSELRTELMWASAPGQGLGGVYVAAQGGKWYGVMFVRRGYWRDAVVRFEVDIPPAYPRVPPEITLMTLVEHPLVRVDDGRFALDARFTQWTPHSNKIADALRFLKNSFKYGVLRQLQARQCYNVAAYMRFKSDLSRFHERARHDAQRSRNPDVLYARPPPDCPIIFSPLSDDQHSAAMQRMATTTASS
ncbi:hypothetical protein GGF46_000885 [Coemansia sp. RSA 552]|nr:hypothetical protein GGF46_000885 [Coemansia sp. RSA 552]